jgi:hypothetical protein
MYWDELFNEHKKSLNFSEYRSKHPSYQIHELLEQVDSNIDNIINFLYQDFTKCFNINLINKTNILDEFNRYANYNTDLIELINKAGTCFDIKKSQVYYGKDLNANEFLNISKNNYEMLKSRQSISPNCKVYTSHIQSAIPNYNKDNIFWTNFKVFRAVVPYAINIKWNFTNKSRTTTSHE